MKKVSVDFRVLLMCIALRNMTLFCFLESNELSIDTLNAFDCREQPAMLTQIDRKRFYSQASQDKFVYGILYGLLQKQDKGCYLEIGSGDPVDYNNSYFFEKELEWNGVSIDISNDFAESWNSLRKNLFLVADATRADYGTILQGFPLIIDYLSLDIDRNYDEVLEQIPFNNYIFKIITIEHDSYRIGHMYRERERQILTALGYHLLCSDVSNQGNAFEDWWIHPSFFSSDELNRLASLDLIAKDHKQIIQAIQTLMINGPIPKQLEKLGV